MLLYLNMDMKKINQKNFLPQVGQLPNNKTQDKSLAEEINQDIYGTKTRNNLLKLCKKKMKKNKKEDRKGEMQFIGDNYVLLMRFSFKLGYLKRIVYRRRIGVWRSMQ